MASERALEVAAGLRRLIESALVCDREEVEIGFEDVGVISTYIIKEAMERVGVRCVTEKKENITTFKLDLRGSKICNDIKDKINDFLWEDECDYGYEDEDKMNDEYEDEESY